MILSIPTLVRELLKEGRLAGETFYKNYKGGCGVGPFASLAMSKGRGHFNSLSIAAASQESGWRPAAGLRLPELAARLDRWIPHDWLVGRYVAW